MSQNTSEECWAPGRKSNVREKYSGIKRRLHFDDVDADSSLNYRIKVYNKNAQIIRDQIVQKEFKKAYGNSQFHSAYVEVLPCGQLRREFLDDDFEDQHDTLYHNEECTGIEHFTTCSNPADPLMTVWSQPCSKRCPTLQDTVQKVRKKITKCC